MVFDDSLGDTQIPGLSLCAALDVFDQWVFNRP